MASIASYLSFEQVAERLMADGLQANKTALVRRLQAMGELKFTSYAEFFRDLAAVIAQVQLWKQYCGSGNSISVCVAYALKRLRILKCK